MSVSEQRGARLRITKQSAQGCWVKVIRPYTIDSSSASRHHTDSLGASTAREKGFVGPTHRRRACRDVRRNQVRREAPSVALIFKGAKNEILHPRPMVDVSRY